MKLLVDTHIALWWMRGDSRLSETAMRLVRDGRNELFWSLASSWEIAIKIGSGKLDLGRPLHRLLGDLVSEQNFQVLEISHHHCAQVADLPLLHRDPFDRMLVAQAKVGSMPILTADSKLARYDVETKF